MITDRIKNWTVLLVDDEPDNLGVAQQILQHFGAQVFTAGDGEEALTLLNTVTPSFIVTDLSMPVIDGWELLKKIREIPRLNHVPVIALTAHAMRGDRERALAAGFDQYITKPFRLTSFLEDLESCINRLKMAV